MTLKGGTSQACAVCKYQRRRCSADCLLAPYFPPDQPKIFQNAHKLFGVSNIVKIIKNLDSDEQKAEAMRSIIYQSNMRDRFPVHGSWGIICQLKCQIYQVEEELFNVHAQLEMYRQHYQAMTDDVVPSQLELAMAPPNYNYGLSLFSNHNVQQQHQQQHSYSNNSHNSPYIMDCKDSMWVQHPFAVNNNGNSMVIQSQPPRIHQELVQDYEELHPFFDTIDDRQSYIVSKQAYESSSEESLKDTTQSTEHVAENELKSAAACFGLTSVN